MAKKEKAFNNNLIIVIAIIIAAIILMPKLGIEFNIGGKDLFGGLSPGDLQNILNNPPTDGQCSLTVTPQAVCAGDFITGRLMDGANTNCFVFVTDGKDWTRLDGRTDSAGVWSNTDRINLVGNYRAIGFCDKDHSGTYTQADCFTNVVDFVVRNCTDTPTPEPPSNPQPGDVIGGGGGSGTISGSGDSIIFDMSNLQKGNCTIGAKIWTEWDYKNQDYWQECTTLGGFAQGVKWTFKDSRARGNAWYKEDDYPQTNVVQLCPLQYDGVKPWELKVEPLYSIPNCEINYQYNVEIIVCEC
jgi:hypothetical protein